MPRIQLVIQCSGRAVNPLSFRPTGRRCRRIFSTEAKYRSRAMHIERARAAGWRVSPLDKDNTVNAFCPRCCGGS